MARASKQSSIAKLDISIKYMDGGKRYPK